MNSPLPPSSELPEVVIEPGRIGRRYWRDLWQYRELFLFLAWRDLLVRYKQTVVGVAWAVVRPLLTMLVLTFVFQGVAGMKAPEGVPYAVMVFAGILPWQFFATSLQESSNSLVQNAGMVSKVYFPRLIVPASSVITSLVDLAISSVVFGFIMVYFRYSPSPNIWALPFFIMLAFATAFGAGMWISALMVRYRDFRFILPFIIQYGLYVSPVGFTTASAFESGRIPSSWQALYSINPMVGVIDGFRWCLIGGDQQLQPAGLAISAGAVVIVIASGLWYFRRTERTFADVI